MLAGIVEFIFMRTIAFSLLTGACLAASVAGATAQPVDPESMLQPSPVIDAINQSEPPATPLPQPAVPAERQHTVAKEILDKVNDFIARRDFPKAIALLTETASKDGTNAELYRLRASVYCRIGNFRSCIDDNSKAIEIDKDYVPAYLLRGLARIDAGLARDALADCELVVLRWPERPLGYNCRGLARRGVGAFAGAIADFDDALVRDGKFAFAHYNKGSAYIMQKKYGDAIGSFTAALAINDKFDDCYALRGKARVASGDVGGGREDFAKALALNGRNINAAVGIQALEVGKAIAALSAPK
jgi:tetratricopeptide (TPR) repeat protein